MQCRLSVAQDRALKASLGSWAVLCSCNMVEDGVRCRSASILTALVKPGKRTH